MTRDEITNIINIIIDKINISPRIPISIHWNDISIEDSEDEEEEDESYIVEC